MVFVGKHDCNYDFQWTEKWIKSLKEYDNNTRKCPIPKWSQSCVIQPCMPEENDGKINFDDIYSVCSATSSSVQNEPCTWTFFVNEKNTTNNRNISRHQTTSNQVNRSTTQPIDISEDCFCDPSKKNAQPNDWIQCVCFPYRKSKFIQKNGTDCTCDHVFRKNCTIGHRLNESTEYIFSTCYIHNNTLPFEQELFNRYAAYLNKTAKGTTTTKIPITRSISENSTTPYNYLSYETNSTLLTTDSNNSSLYSTTYNLSMPNNTSLTLTLKQTLSLNTAHTTASPSDEDNTTTSTSVMPTSTANLSKYITSLYSLHNNSKPSTLFMTTSSSLTNATTMTVLEGRSTSMVSIPTSREDEQTTTTTSTATKNTESTSTLDIQSTPITHTYNESSNTSNPETSYMSSRNTPTLPPDNQNSSYTRLLTTRLGHSENAEKLTTQLTTSVDTRSNTSTSNSKGTTEDSKTTSRKSVTSAVTTEESDHTSESTSPIVLPTFSDGIQNVTCHNNTNRESKITTRTTVSVRTDEITTTLSSTTPSATTNVTIAKITMRALPSTAASNITGSNTTTSNVVTSNTTTSNTPTSDAGTSNTTTYNTTISDAATLNTPTSNTTTSNTPTSDAGTSNTPTSDADKDKTTISATFKPTLKSTPEVSISSTRTVQKDETTVAPAWFSEDTTTFKSTTDSITTSKLIKKTEEKISSPSISIILDKSTLITSSKRTSPKNYNFISTSKETTTLIKEISKVVPSLFENNTVSKVTSKKSNSRHEQKINIRSHNLLLENNDIKMSRVMTSGSITALTTSVICLIIILYYIFIHSGLLKKKKNALKRRRILKNDF